MLNKNTEKVSLFTAISFVIANMIGTGVFTSIGFQLLDINDVFAVLLLWVIGGVIAITGANVYGELGSVMPRSGGEYHYLSEIYHPIVGYLSGFFLLLLVLPHRLLSHQWL
ncbi:amino acid permease [bacterium]|nr:amino acid permease [bacterium]